MPFVRRPGRIPSRHRAPSGSHTSRSDLRRSSAASLLPSRIRSSRMPCDRGRSLIRNRRGPRPRRSPTARNPSRESNRGRHWAERRPIRKRSRPSSAPITTLPMDMPRSAMPSRSPEGGRITRGVERLKAAAQRGRELPPLPAAERATLVAESGPALIQAVDRVIQQIQALKSTPGIRSDFDRLIDAYTRTRQGIDQEMNPQTARVRVPNIPRPPSPPPFPPGPGLRPRGGRFRGRP